MKLLDANVWLALALSAHSHHRVARTWFESEPESAGFCFCRATQQGLVRLLTTERILAAYGNPPLSNREAWAVYERFMGDGRIALLHEPEGVEETWKKLALRGRDSPKLWMAAWLAAFAIQSGVQLVTTDNAFSQFKGLHTHVLKAP